MSLRAVEFFCGIGGFAAAVADSDVRIVAAFDQDPAALATYRLNLPEHPARQVDLGRVSAWEITTATADIWWLSPPCQPYCERGARRDLDDHRAESFIHLLDILERIPDDLLPGYLALENVAGFIASQARSRLVTVLETRGYLLKEQLLCPTELGIPSRRPRYYLTASLLPCAPVIQKLSVTGLRPLAAYLDHLPGETFPEELIVPQQIIDRFGSGFRIIDPKDPNACTTCFTSSYGRSLMNAGSYLYCGSQVRRFSPEEVIRLLQFPEQFRFSEGLTLRRRWGLAGNSLSVAAVQEVLSAFPEFHLPGRQTSERE